MHLSLKAKSLFLCFDSTLHNMCIKFVLPDSLDNLCLFCFFYIVVC